MNNLNEQRLRQQIRYHWDKVNECREAILALYDAGEPFTSPRYTELSRRVDRHGAELVTLDQLLEAEILAQA